MEKQNLMIYHYDAFSRIPGNGNPAGIVLNADQLSEEQMQEIAKQVGFNETAFILQSDAADLRIRYFTPGHEMNLCGHATVATAYCLHERCLLQGKDEVMIETKAGIISLKIKESDNGTLIEMMQISPSFETYSGSHESLAAVLGITANDIDDNLPIVYGSTGTWTLLVPVKELSVFERMKPQNELFPSVLEQKPSCSIHPFCFQTLKEGRQVHSRHFSSPYSGTVEDPVTGTASGVIGCYYAAYVDPHMADYHFIMEQGHEVGRDGEVHVYVSNSPSRTSVAIAGSAVFVGTIDLDIPALK